MKGKNKRRLSGPTWVAPIPRPEPIQSHPSGHVVDRGVPHRSHSHSHLAGHGQWGHPYQHPAGVNSHHHHHHRPHPEESPSPISSDSEALSRPTTSPPCPTTRTHSHSQSNSSLSVHHTPSTSPFLGPLRTLNLHSEGPSRAASPFRLPSAVLDGDVSGSPIEDHPLSPSRSSLVDSPRQPGFSDIRSRSSVEISPSSSFSIPSSGHFPAGRGPRFVNTPQLSSGPSSNDSSPGSYPHSLASSTTRHQPEIAVSNTSSRAASPPLSNNSGHIKNRSASSPSNHLPHLLTRERESGPAHRTLAQSLRLAFGMTPIHPQQMPGYGGLGSHTTPGGATPFPARPSHIQALSMPASRSSSPPITLPPLKFGPPNLPSCPTSPVQDTEMEDATVPNNRPSKPKIELPGFSEFTAASGIRNLPV